MLPDFSRLERQLRIGAALVACAILLPLCAVQYLWSWLDRPLPVPAPVLVELAAGSNLTFFLADMQQRGLLDHPSWLRYYARFTKVADQVRAGEYRIEPGVTPRGMLQQLLDGDVVQYPITIIEGMTLAQVLQILRQEPKLRLEAQALQADGVLAALRVTAEKPSAEGLFFPDTYLYHHGMSNVDVLGMAYARMQMILEEEWQGRASGLPYKNAYEALIMASLIEKETGVGEERAAIAGVFVRRMQSGMLLQTDPAVIYGLGEHFDGNLTREHLQREGPYNTYANAGLPPTPIAMPGRAAIAAALHPAGGDALYFVARGDGTHQFSATLAEHNKAVSRLQVAKRSRNYRSRPPG